MQLLAVVGCCLHCCAVVLCARKWRKIAYVHRRKCNKDEEDKGDVGFTEGGSHHKSFLGSRVTLQP